MFCAGWCQALSFQWALLLGGGVPAVQHLSSTLTLVLAMGSAVSCNTCLQRGWMVRGDGRHPVGGRIGGAVCARGCTPARRTVLGCISSEPMLMGPSACGLVTGVSAAARLLGVADELGAPAGICDGRCHQGLVPSTLCIKLSPCAQHCGAAGHCRQPCARAGSGPCGAALTVAYAQDNSGALPVAVVAQQHSAEALCHRAGAGSCNFEAAAAFSVYYAAHGAL